MQGVQTIDISTITQLWLASSVHKIVHMRTHLSLKHFAPIIAPVNSITKCYFYLDFKGLFIKIIRSRGN